VPADLARSVVHLLVSTSHSLHGLQRCKAGGHECLFEESNRGKRSTRKNEALTARILKMEAALRGIGTVLLDYARPILYSS
jgi:hypothetical protein